MIAAVICAVIAVATLVNLAFISQRPETISVVNVLIGQGVLIIGFFALARLLFVRAKKRMTAQNEEPTD